MRAFKWGTVWSFPQGASEWPEVKVLAFQIHLIKQDFSCTFRFDFWQFWCPLKKKFMQYLIWKLSLVWLRTKRLARAWQHFYIAQYNLEEYLFYYIQSQKCGFEGAQLYNTLSVHDAYFKNQIGFDFIAKMMIVCKKSYHTRNKVCANSCQELVSPQRNRHF